MLWSINVPNLGSFADPRGVADLAREAEGAGWDAVFVWDHLIGMPGAEVADPWTILTAVALATERVRIGPMVTPLARRRPWQVARQAATLDRLSGGRVTLGVGLGFPPEEEFGRFGEPTDDRERAAILDEALDVIVGLWTGEPFSFEGERFRVRDVTFVPTPLQRPRIPIWIAATWPHRAPLARAARFDGVVPIADPAGDEPFLDLDRVADVVREIRGRRAADAGPFDVVWVAPPAAGASAALETVERAAAASVTWVQMGSEFGEDLEGFRDRVRRGPPR